MTAHDDAKHRRLRRVRGPAKLQQCVRCPKQAHDWAQVHTETGEDPWADYVPLCRGCHLRYDGNSRRPHQLTPDGLARQREARRNLVGLGQCGGCGIDRTLYTRGCKTCIARRGDRKRQPRNRSGRS